MQAKSGKNRTQGKGLRPLVLILPHAGHVYSGPVAASGYALLEGTSPGIIVIIARSHHGYFRGCSILPVDYYETPLGRVLIAKGIAARLLENENFKTDRPAHRREHSIEIHLPFLQRIYKKRIESIIPVLPVLVGEIDNRQTGQISGAITEAIKGKKDPLFIISSDFTHFGPRFGYQPFKGAGKTLIAKKVKKLDY